MYTRYFARCTISCEVNILSPSSQHHNCLPPLPPSIPTQVITTHSRLYRRARTAGGSVSGLLPTRHRRCPRRRVPPGPAALSPGFDWHGWGPDMSRLRRRAWAGGGSVSRLLPTRCRRRPRRQAHPGPAALSPGSDRWWLSLLAHTCRHPLACPNGTDARGQSHHPSCMTVESVRHQRSWAKSPPCCMSVRHRRPWAMSTLKYRTVPRKIGLMFSHSLGPMVAFQRLLQVGLTAIILQIHSTISCAECLAQRLMTHSGMKRRWILTACK
jgi:hypothetical protein